MGFNPTQTAAKESFGNQEMKDLLMLGDMNLRERR